MELQRLIESRRSVNNFDKDENIPVEDIQTMIEAAILSPSSYNLQHWHFLVITDKQRKLELKEAARGQQKIEDASAAILVLGNLKSHEHAPVIVEDLVSKGYVNPEVKEKLVNNIYRLYDNKDMRRDEAIRGASLAAMTLMLKAQDLNYGTCPMVNFDPVKMRKLFNIPEHLIPVMIIGIGRDIGAIKPRKLRFSLEKVVNYNFL